MWAFIFFLIKITWGLSNVCCKLHIIIKVFIYRTVQGIIGQALTLHHIIQATLDLEST